MSVQAMIKSSADIEGGISCETFVTLRHILRAFSDCIKYLLDENNFRCLLPRKLNNDPTEKTVGYESFQE